MKTLPKLFIHHQAIAEKVPKFQKMLDLDHCHNKITVTTGHFLVTGEMIINKDFLVTANRETPECKQLHLKAKILLEMVK